MMMNKIQVQSLPQNRFRRHILIHLLTRSYYVATYPWVLKIFNMYKGTKGRLYSMYEEATVYVSVQAFYRKSQHRPESGH